jgi:hypothetical protein
LELKIRLESCGLGLDRFKIAAAGRLLQRLKFAVIDLGALLPAKAVPIPTVL